MIVDKHNELRRKVAKGLEARGLNGGQPKAADMFELVWDPVLAASAQRLDSDITFFRGWNMGGRFLMEFVRKTNYILKTILNF